MFGKKKTSKIKGDTALKARSAALTGPASEGSANGVDTGDVWLAAIETVMPEAAIAYASQADGTTAAYYSSGKAFPHLGDVDAVAKASTEFVEAMAEGLDLLDKADSLTELERGHVRLYARKGDDTYVAEALEDIVAAGGHPLAPLYKKGQSVMKQAQLALSR